MAFVSAARAFIDRLPARGFIIAFVFVAVAGLWWLGAQIFMGLAAVGLAMLSGSHGSVDAADLLPTWLMVVGYGLTVGGMALIAAVLAPLTGRTLGQAFALRPTRWWVWPLAGLGGLSVGLLPGWLAEEIQTFLPDIDLGALQMLTEALTTGPLWERGLMVFTVVVLAPFLEELVFRGFLWDALQQSTRPSVVWLLTSILFAIYHVDPVQSSAVLFTGLALGWLRWHTGSIWPSVLLHMVNNSLATALTWSFAGQEEPSVPLWGALLGMLLTAALLGPILLAPRSEDPA